MKKILALLSLLAFSWPLQASPSPEKIETDLALEATLTTPAINQAGEPVEVDLVLHNKSKTDSYQVVKPGDGSEAGWREPHIFFTATLDPGTGKVEDVPTIPYGRCGLFDNDWQKDVLALKPGEKLPLKGWLPPPSTMLDFQKAGHVRLYVHYRYSVGLSSRNNSPVPALGAMSGTPAFELVSVPAEFDVIRPLELVLSTKKPLKANAKTKLSDLFDIRLLNQSKETLHFSYPTLSGDARIFLQVQSKAGVSPSFTLEKSQAADKYKLVPGGNVDLLAGNGVDGLWEYPAADTIRVRAGFMPSSWKNGNSVLYSQWIEIQVAKSP